MNTYFCPRCGSGYESGEATQRTWARVVCVVYCPTCDQELQVTGGTVILLGLLFTLVLGGLSVLISPALSGAILASCIAIGVLRIVRQRRARARTRRAGPEAG